MKPEDIEVCPHAPSGVLVGRILEVAAFDGAWVIARTSDGMFLERHPSQDEAILRARTMIAQAFD